MEDAQVPHLLFTIEDTFLIKGRGLISIPAFQLKMKNTFALEMPFG